MFHGRVSVVSVKVRVSVSWTCSCSIRWGKGECFMDVLV